MKIDEDGFYCDINHNRTFIDSGKLAKYIYNHDGLFTVTGGLTLDCKREGALIIKNLGIAIRKEGVPKNEGGWRKVAQVAVEIG